MQPAKRKQSNINDLEHCLDAFVDQRLKFSELRKQWAALLADNPEMRKDAVRLLYRQPSSKRLSEKRRLALKRVAEAALHDEQGDWTDVFFEEDGAESRAVDLVDNVDLVDSIDAVSGKVVTGRANTRAAKPTRLRPEPQAAPPQMTISDALVPGRVLNDRFVLEAPLGVGGMGVVYRAHDRLRQKAVGESSFIALKILREEFSSKPELMNALQREALQTQCLTHPNIVRVYDFHRDGETCFLTMELLEGEPLKTVIARTRPAAMATDRAMRIITGMCSGIAHARAHGMVHSDFKPGNVFLTSDDEPKILDFGPARVAATRGASVEPGSMSLHTFTPAYASCNRLEYGAPNYSDDVYSLSCVIYELLAGHHPYDRKSALEVRESKLQPKRIECLTELQWLTLAAGLEPSQQDRTTEVFHLQTAFTYRPPPEAPEAPEAPELPAETNPFFQEKHVKKNRLKKKHRRGPAVTAITGTFLSAGLVFGIAILGISGAPSKTIDPAQESEPVRMSPSAPDNRTNESTVPEVPTSSVSSPKVTSNSSAIISVADSATPLPTSNVIAGDLDSKVPASPVADNSSFLLDSAYFVRENVAAIEVQIKRQGDLSNEATVEWSTFAGSAEPHRDYVNVFRRPVSFAAGEKIKSVFISIVSDDTEESAEVFQVVLTRPGDDMTLSENPTRTITIIDDDT